MNCQLAGNLPRVERELRKGRAVVPPPPNRRCHRRAQRLVVAVGVEEIALRAFVEQPLLLVLTVDLDEGCGNLAEPGRCHGLVVDPGRRPTRRRDLADADEGLRRRSNRASTRAASAPCLTRLLSARAPVARPSASISRLLPAPVSPVSTLKPGANGSRTRSMSARSATASSSRGPTDGSSAPTPSSARGGTSQATAPTSAAASRGHRGPLAVVGHRPLRLTTGATPPCGEGGPRRAPTRGARSIEWADRAPRRQPRRRPRADGPRGRRC